MNLYDRYFFPWIIERVMASKDAEDLRRGVLTDAGGEILEIGFGTGMNLPCYPEHVRKITVVEPHPQMNRYAQKRISASSIEVDAHLLGAERLPFADGSFDSVVSTWTLCSIPDIRQALGEVRRVMKANGRFIFLEHGLSQEVQVQAWQRRINPLWNIFSNGCQLDRDIPALLSGAGFNLVRLERFCSPKSSQLTGSSFKGIGMKA